MLFFTFAETVLCQPYHNYRENNINECGLKSSIIIEASGLWTTRKTYFASTLKPDDPFFLVL
jgi:hypothetical protein